MPVPWRAERRWIPRIEHRAITIQQLRDLHNFIKRLCKTRLLQGKGGGVFDVNMYDIAQFIIKPAIQFEEERRGTRQQYSWVEFVAEAEEQVPDLMFSHSWAGRFQDFMSAVNKLARGRGLGGSVAVWVCTFANSQFGEDLGTGLRDSPFFKAIGVARQGVLLMVDRDASSLQRIWCGFELHVTMKMQRPLSIFTSMGQVGVQVTTGPLVEAIERWDVRRMEASLDTDRRQILNYLAGGELREKHGLKTNEDGNLCLVDGWRKQLANEQLAEDAPRRLSGQQEYAHEAHLFEAHAEAFRKLNGAVREKVRQAAQAVAADGTGVELFELPRKAQRGVTLGELRQCIAGLRARTDRWEEMTVFEFAKEWVTTLCPSGCSYAEVVSGGPRTPQYVINEVWGCGLRHTMSSIEWAAEALQLHDSAVLYFSPLCSRSITDEVETWDEDVEVLIKNCDGWISVTGRTVEGIVRSSRMQQLLLCFAHARPIYFACADGVLAGLEPFGSSSWEFGTFDPAIARMLLSADWEAALSSNQKVKERIREQVRRSPGGFAGFVARVVSVVAGPVLRHAALSSDPEAVREVEAICGRRGFKINGKMLRGALGESPLHIAAASGNVRAMEVLLAAKADPNAEDEVLDTPLHYAAMTGMATSVRVLLAHGAIAQAESAFAETPLRMARQSPAAFLGCDTRGVVALLEAWEAACEEPEEQEEE